MSKPTAGAKLLKWVQCMMLLAMLLIGCNSDTDPETAVQQTIAARDAEATQSAQASIPTPTATSTATPVTPTPTPTSAPPTATATATALPPTPQPTATATATLMPVTPLPPRPTLNTLLPPNFGSMSLSVGFLPDPTIINLTSGGDVDVSYLNNSFSCTGYATAAPDFRLFWSGNSDELNFMFIPDFSGDDTTLIINDPNGNWFCNDDFDGVNPGIRLNTAVSGQYDIWIGSYSSYENISGQLKITEFAIPLQLDPSPSTELNPSLDPNYGSVSLSSGFLPDPAVISLTSGGNVDVSYLNNGFGCNGYATAAPDFRLFWSGEGNELNFMFTANFGGDDTTLIINDPNGSWHCNDDFDGVSPGIRFNTALPGQYDIWIGSYSSENNISGQLNITEFAIP